MLSVAVHTMLVLGFVRPHASGGVQLAASALQARLVTQASSPASTAPSEAGPPSVGSGQTGANPPTATPERTHGSAVPAAAASASTPSESTLQSGLPPAPGYREAKGLNPPPRPLQAIEPVYPESAGLQEGSVVLRLLISSSGDVDEVAVVRASPAGLFEESALQAFARAKFAPGYFLGIPVKSQIFIEVGYTPINRGGAVSGQNR